LTYRHGKQTALAESLGMESATGFHSH
jgi:hypothetical protein